MGGSLDAQRQIAPAKLQAAGISRNFKESWRFVQHLGGLSVYPL
jgi:hypothetical protein